MKLTFRLFRQTQFHTSRSHGYHMVHFAGVYLDILRIGTACHEDLTPFLTHETLARPLAPLTSAEQRFEALGWRSSSAKKPETISGKMKFVRPSVLWFLPFAPAQREPGRVG